MMNIVDGKEKQLLKFNGVAVVPGLVITMFWVCSVDISSPDESRFSVSKLANDDGGGEQRKMTRSFYQHLQIRKCFIIRLHFPSKNGDMDLDADAVV